jgi:hypothetical protein
MKGIEKGKSGYVCRRYGKERKFKTSLPVRDF